MARVRAALELCHKVQHFNPHRSDLLSLLCVCKVTPVHAHAVHVDLLLVLLDCGRPPFADERYAQDPPRHRLRSLDATL